MELPSRKSQAARGSLATFTAMLARGTAEKAGHSCKKERAFKVVHSRKASGKFFFF